MGWDTILGDFANIETIVAGLVGSVGTVAYQHYVKDAETLLEDCRKDLEEVKARLDEIPPERQEKIRAAAERDVCKSLDKIRESLLSLSDDRCELSQRLGSSSYWQRKGPRTQLRDDIYTLKDSVKRLWKDTCNTTNFPVKEARQVARSQSQQPPEHPTNGPSAPSSSPVPRTSSSSVVPRTSTAGGSPQSTQIRPSFEQFEYLRGLITYPPSTHIPEERDITTLGIMV